MRVTSSRRGMVTPALISASKPNAPPNLSAYQYSGGTQSYGPSIFRPDGNTSATVRPVPLTGACSVTAGVPLPDPGSAVMRLEAAATTGVGQSDLRRMSIYG